MPICNEFKEGHRLIIQIGQVYVLHNEKRERTGWARWNEYNQSFVGYDIENKAFQAASLIECCHKAENVEPTTTRYALGKLATL